MDSPVLTQQFSICSVSVCIISFRRCPVSVSISRQLGKTFHGIGDIQTADFPVFLIVQADRIRSLSVCGDFRHSPLSVAAKNYFFIRTTASLWKKRLIFPFISATEQDPVSRDKMLAVYPPKRLPCSILRCPRRFIIALATHIVSRSCLMLLLPHHFY